MLFFALLIDAAVGDPKWLWGRVPHPVTLMGAAIEWADGNFNSGAKARLAGAGVAAAIIVGSAGIGAIIWFLPDFGILGMAVAASLLAHKSLCEHVKAVAVGLGISLSEGRANVAQVVGRDPERLDEAGVARAAIESAAESFSDGVVAPAFWFLLLGPAGIIMHKFVNTADSMIGHRTERHKDFGWAVARLDDAMNWIPARIAGGLIALCYWSKKAWTTMIEDARKHRSPNAGWPEAAMAGVLGVALSGPRSYGGDEQDHPFINEGGKMDPGPDEISASVQVLWRVWIGVLAIAATLAMVL